MCFPNIAATVGCLTFTVLNGLKVDVCVDADTGRMCRGTFKGRVGNFGETSSSALEFENTQPEKSATSLQSPSSNTHERAHDQ